MTTLELWQVYELKKDSSNTLATQEKFKSEVYIDTKGGNLFFSDLGIYLESAIDL